MTHPNPIPNRDDPFAGLVADMERELSKDAQTGQPVRAFVPSTPPSRPAAPPAGTAAPGFGQAGVGGGKRGPLTPTNSPLEALHAAAESAYQMHQKVEVLLAGLTGEKRQQPIGPRPTHKGALLPTISGLATEIEVVLNETARLLEHMQAKIGS